MTITVTIAYNVPADAFERAKAVAAEYVERDSFFNGANITVRRGDFTGVDTETHDPYDTARLYESVMHAIDFDDRGE